MTRRQKYYLKQRLIGLTAVIVSAVLIILTKDFVEDRGVLLLPLAFGLFMMFTKEMIVMDSYYLEIEEQKEFKRKMRRRS